MDLKNFIPAKDDIVVELGFKNSEGEWIKKLQNSDGSTMTITVMSPFSKESRKVIHEINDKRIKIAAKKKEKNLSAEEIEDIVIETLVATTRDWNITWDGEKPKFDKELAKQIYAEAFWIRNLIEDEKGKTLDFMSA